MKPSRLAILRSLVALALAFVVAGTAPSSAQDPTGAASDLNCVPGAPRARNVELVGQIGGPVSAVAVQGSLAYAGVGPRLVVLDVSDPAQPSLVGESAPLSALVGQVEVNGTYAYVRADGISVFDVADPARPTLVGFHPEGGAFAVAGTQLYLTAGLEGLRIVDVSDPANPVETGFYDTPGDASAVATAGDLVYVADGSGGLWVLRLGDPPWSAGTWCAPRGHPAG